MKLSNPYTRLLAYIRLQRIKQLTNDRRTFTNTLWKGLNQERFSSYDRSVMIKDLERMNLIQTNAEKMEAERKHLEAERAMDNHKFTIV